MTKGECEGSRTVKTIVLGTDGSAGARRATREAIELAVDTGWPLRIVSVWSVPPLELSAASMIAGELAGAARDQAQDALDLAAGEAAGAGVGSIAYLRHGEVAREIVKVAESIGGTVIVVGSDGRGALGQALLGSVSTRLVHIAPCPVLVVRSASPADADVETSDRRPVATRVRREE